MAALTATTASATASPGGSFGYHKVRAGVPSGVSRFTLTSPDVKDGGGFPAASWSGQFGCEGSDQALRLRWTGAPSTTRSYAISMYDPDAPTGSGFWHWMNWDVPASATSLSGKLPEGAVAGANDAGAHGYLGPCPPAGDRTHHYQVTVLALDVPTLSLPAGTGPAMASFAMGGHVVGIARLNLTARRPAA
ncbi:MAG: YbhB/YbcL family Raf kinase inhibitor-like protein [Nonomuraea sp.]|nr:YbhB/YbcL family Raf kinase inhibitor-like protein [Nonomuraea sp.]NUP63427.1 YbhB/YbcL family Raf kinase inhibitor-like protein [Nonomuraea sp.]NUP77819.1 YbhB/YbcL family Raf kinase inhibitor-like protein [Nonomuraea sp.]